MDKAVLIYIQWSIAARLLSPKKERMPFALTWMDLEIIILSKVSQRKTNTILLSLICGV